MEAPRRALAHVPTHSLAATPVLVHVVTRVRERAWVATIWGPLSRSAAASSRHLYLVKHWLAFTLGSRRPGDAYTCAKGCRVAILRTRQALIKTLPNPAPATRTRAQRQPRPCAPNPLATLALSPPQAQDAAPPSREHSPSAMRLSQHTSLAEGVQEAGWGGGGAHASGCGGGCDRPGLARLLKVLGGVQPVRRLLRLRAPRHARQDVQAA